MATAEQTARKQPALVIAGGLALGLVAARFLRSAGGGSSSSGFQGGSQGMGYASPSGSGDWYDVGTGAGSSGSSASNLGTRPYSMGATTAGQSESGFGNGSGSEDPYRLAESGE